jgi:integrase
MVQTKNQTVQKIKALAARPGTEGEGKAAVAALNRMPALTRKRLTDALIKTLPTPPTGNRIHYDAPDKGGNNYTRGFGVRVTAGGARSFVLNYRAKNGREGRCTIGSPPDWSLTAAREKAKELKRLIDGGADPAKEEHEKRTADNINALCDEFIAAHVSKKREATRKEYIGIIDKYIREELGTTKVADVRFVDVDRLHRKISAHAPYRANRAIAVLSKMFSLAIQWGIRAAIDGNPVKGVERNVEDKRHRYLSADELGRLHKTLDRHRDQDAANVIRLLLFTGARRNEALLARWGHFDLADGVWVKPGATTKQKTLHRVPLSDQAIKLLKAMPVGADADLVFPDVDKENLRRAWLQVCKTAGLKDLHTHDLRHSYASVLASDGVSLPTIGALLGHTQASTTNRYAHLADDALRSATNRAGRVLGRRNER